MNIGSGYSGDGSGAPSEQDVLTGSEVGNSIRIESVQSIDFDIVTLLQLFWRSRILILVSVASCFILTVFYLNAATYTYTVEYQVTPTEAGQGSLMGMLGGVGALAGVKLGGDEPASPFSLYLEGLRGRTVAADVAADPFLMQRMFPDQWDDAAKAWRQPDGIVPALLSAVKSTLGLPVRAWHPPGPAEAELFLQRRVSVAEIPKRSLAVVGIRHKDPDFGIALLKKLHASSDEHIRRRSLERSTAYIDYLEQRLPVVSIAEQRQALAQMMSAQEKQRIMASAGVAFSAELFSPPVSSPAPTWPKPSLLLAISLVVGIFFGCLLAFGRYLFRARQRGQMNAA